MSDLIDTTEMYLRTIFELIEDGVTPMRARIAEQLDHSGPTVSQTVARMERDGLVVVSEDRHLELTVEGRLIAVRVMRKHRLAERMLVEVMGLPLHEVHEEACRWEHVMSDRVEKRILSMLAGPHVSPYGNAIPGLAELGVESSDDADQGSTSLREAASATVTYVTLVRIGEAPQTDPGFLEDVAELGLLPGATVAISEQNGVYTIGSEGGELDVHADAARHIFVTPGVAPTAIFDTVGG